MNAAHPIVTIGASGAGLYDICDLLDHVPVALAAPVLVVLHRPPHGSSDLRRVLQRASVAPVKIAEVRQELRPGTVYIGEPTRHLLVVERGRSALLDDGRMRYRNRTINILFDSVAQHYGRNAVGIVLSGSSNDGASGLYEISMRSGLCLAVDPVRDVWGDMPRNAIERVPACHVSSLPKIAGKLLRTVGVHCKLK